MPRKNTAVILPEIQRNIFNVKPIKASQIERPASRRDFNPKKKERGKRKRFSLLFGRARTQNRISQQYTLSQQMNN